MNLLCLSAFLLSHGQWLISILCGVRRRRKVSAKTKRNEQHRKVPMGLVLCSCRITRFCALWLGVLFVELLHRFLTDPALLVDSHLPLRVLYSGSSLMSPQAISRFFFFKPLKMRIDFMVKPEGQRPIRSNQQWSQSSLFFLVVLNKYTKIIYTFFVQRDPGNSIRT